MPINYSLEKWGLENIILKKGHPVYINRLMKEGQVLVAPISSYEYIKNEKNYVLIKEACIASKAECGSVLLFSNRKFEDLAGCTVALPDDSATSAEMLKILLKKKGIFLQEINFVPHKYELNLPDFLSPRGKIDAVLYIGNNALISAAKYNDKIIQYDIGRLWKDTTGFPPVFGVWAARADWAINHADDFQKIKLLIGKAVEAGLGMYFNEIIKKASADLFLPENTIRDYLSAKIKYDYTPEHEAGLEYFKELTYEII